jgi:hypothetical protein
MSILPIRGGDPPQVGEGLQRVLQAPQANATPTPRYFQTIPQDYSPEPFHQLRWSPFPEGKDG